MEFSRPFCNWLHFRLLPPFTRLCTDIVHGLNSCCYEHRACNYLVRSSWYSVFGLYIRWFALWFICVLMPGISSEIFGLRHFATIFNPIAIASPIGSYILSVRIVGFIYDKESSASAIHACIGQQCFMSSFLIMASTCILGVASSMVLFFSEPECYTVRFYTLEYSLLNLIP
ncbi:uncharacterized protein LOC120267793 [Dioscorea cayenensis subsp. rotundata]|uniref:Uncharacterized protein LOC120267793 n=1 Tax=Dioscorea cayennensis subsp. rotundata TaxID=55577 RepID=A0AB40BXQ2_DIOCR|nr:uncharacterized protein LOC120267793 [Dioscorea cayenensis subsp. rotundata]